MSTSSYLVRPTAAYKELYLGALCEGYVGPGQNEPYSGDNIAAIAADFDNHLRSLDRDGQVLPVHNGRLMPSVPSNDSAQTNRLRSGRSLE